MVSPILPLPQITIDARLRSLDQQYAAQVRAIVDDAGLELADELQRLSPEGGSKGLKSGWDLQATSRRRNSLDVRFTITNTAPAALYRIVGRGPGRIPPFDEGSSIDQWVKKVQGVADPVERKKRRYLIARSIARRGTERWRSGENFLGLNPKTLKYNKDSIVLKYRDRVLMQLRSIQLPKRRR